MRTLVVVPWHNHIQLESFLDAWGVSATDPRLVLQRDTQREGCARTKNRGVERAIAAGAEIVIVLDDDCYPSEIALGIGQDSLAVFISRHEEALEPQPVDLFEAVTEPPSRGTPYFTRAVEMPVAASMGFWEEVGDYDAPGQLVHGARHPMKFLGEVMFARYFPLCGMNLAFRASEWPWCMFINVPRFDDIWQGFLWQKKAYSEGKCFNLCGPLVKHSRQSNVWQNLRDEACNLERNETIWQEIHRMPLMSHYEMLARLQLST